MCCLGGAFPCLLAPHLPPGVDKNEKVKLGPRRKPALQAQVRAICIVPGPQTQVVTEIP